MPSPLNGNECLNVAAHFVGIPADDPTMIRVSIEWQTRQVPHSVSLAGLAPLAPPPTPAPRPPSHPPPQEAGMRPPSPPPPSLSPNCLWLSPTEAALVGVLQRLAEAGSREWVPAEEMCRQADVPLTSSTRIILSNLAERCILEAAQGKGYRLNVSAG